MERYILIMINLVKANKNNIDMNFILKIRNEKLVRKFSKNNKIISSINHKKWYLNNEKKEMVVIQKN